MRLAPADNPMPWRDPAEVAAIEVAVLESRRRQAARSVTATGGQMSENTISNASVARLRNIGNGMIREADELRVIGSDFLRLADEKEQQGNGLPPSTDLPAERGGERALPIQTAAANAVANGQTAAHAAPSGL